LFILASNRALHRVGPGAAGRGARQGPVAPDSAARADAPVGDPAGGVSSDASTRVTHRCVWADPAGRSRAAYFHRISR